MLSILIPTYNYNVFPLAEEIHKQVVQTGIIFEIICLDDASKTLYLENEKINLLSDTKYEMLKTNLGRSKIRNLLSKKAQYDWLLYLDVDVFPKDQNFILNYLPFLNTATKVVNGGILYQPNKPDKSKLFRWVYGKNREALECQLRQKKPYLSFLTLNFLLHKSIFESVSFNEEIPNLRHEETLFSYDLMQREIFIHHINNPVYHLGLDPFDTAIRKENESIIALKFLTDHQMIGQDYLRISMAFYKVKSLKLIPIIAFLHRIFKEAILKNLSGNFPLLFLFDCYRLGYWCSIENKSIAL